MVWQIGLVTLNNMKKVLLLSVFVLSGVSSYAATGFPQAPVGYNVYYTSKIGTYHNATPTSASGASNDAPVIQAILDMATNNRPIQIVHDAGFCSLATNLVIRSNTKFRVEPGCGFIMSNNTYCSILTTPLTGAGTNINATNVVIEGGVWNGNRAAQFPIAGPYVMEGNPVPETGLYACGFWIAGVSNMIIRDVEIRNASVYAIAINDSTDVAIYNTRARWTNSSGGNDGVHQWGSTTNIYIDNFTSNGGDDIFAFNTSQFKAYSQATAGINQRWQTNYGIHTNITIINSGRVGGSGQWIRWEGHASLRDAIWGFTMRNFNGVIKNGCSSAGLEMRRVTFDGINLYIDPAYNSSGTSPLSFIGCTNDMLNLNNIHIMDPSGAFDATGASVISVDSLINQVNITGLTYSAPQATVTELIGISDSGTTNSFLNINNCVINGPFNFFTAGATWKGKVRLSNIMYNGNTNVLNISGFTNVTGDASFRHIQTNFVSGAYYINTFGGPIEVKANATLTTAAVVGGAKLELRIAGAGGTTNQSAVQTVGTSIPVTYTNILSGVVPYGYQYVFTNTSVGAGNSAALNGGQISTY